MLPPIGELEVVEESATRGINNPRLEALISSIAAAFGVLPVVLIPTFCANDRKEIIWNKRTIPTNFDRRFIVF